MTTTVREGTEVYDDFTAPGGYTLEHYAAKWITPFGLGEMEIEDTRSFDEHGFHVSAVPFRTASDASVLDHPKYFALSSTTIPVPVTGSVRISSTITASTPGTERGRVVHGTYLDTGAPYAEPVIEGQQAAAVMNVIDFSSGQLFDWFVSGTTALALIERLPSAVSGNTTDESSPDWVGRDKMYTQVVAELPVGPGPHEVSIRFTRDTSTGCVDYYLDGALVAHVDHVGVPLDQQGVPYTGCYPSLGPGEEVSPKVNSVSIGHGMFSLLDAFPFQHPAVPELAVTIPDEERCYGQGVVATFADFRVETTGTP